MRWLAAVAIVMAGCAPRTALVAGAIEAGAGTLMVGHAALSDSPGWGSSELQTQMTEVFLGVPLLVVGTLSVLYGLVERENK